MFHGAGGACRPPAVLVCCLQLGERRMKQTEIVTKLIAGTAAFYLGKKVTAALGLAVAGVAEISSSRLQATEYASHRWTLYVRGAQGEDLTHFVSKVTGSSSSWTVASPVTFTAMLLAGWPAGGVSAARELPEPHS